MMPVNDAQVREPGSYDRRSWKIPVPLDKGCSCPKPLTSVFDICGWCLVTKGGVADYPSEAIEGFAIKGILTRLNALKLPFQACPIANRQIAKESIPFGESERQ